MIIELECALKPLRFEVTAETIHYLDKDFGPKLMDVGALSDLLRGRVEKTRSGPFNLVCLDVDTIHSGCHGNVKRSEWIALLRAHYGLTLYGKTPDQVW